MATKHEQKNQKRAAAARAKVRRLEYRITVLLEQLKRAAVQEHLAWERFESDDGLER